MQKVNANIRIAWEKRSLNYGKKPEGVLPKALPRPVNNYLDNWMYQQIKLKITKKRLKILDVGCGYGRLSARILHDFPKTRVFGVDIAQYYVDLYNKSLGSRGVARRADIRRLPFAKNMFDLVFVVTTLMYVLKRSEQEQAIKECLRTLRPGGYLVIIERNPTGQSIVTLGGLITKLRGKKHAEIPSVSFNSVQMTTLIKKSGGKFLYTGGMPFWTLSLPLSVLLSYFNSTLLQWFLGIILRVDRKFSRLLTPSLYIAYTCSK